ncbi:hypothetical protein NPIL_44761 [Nephila pilipes]|uniref:Uncharacterized protein n=1 Tax=Nephila pilipes TaxID=299642 RepID=A0A8X6IH07_NEPPI|nr:hypothetical protein NPIL_44761 [Nephila pilipes]
MGMPHQTLKSSLFPKPPKGSQKSRTFPNKQIKKNLAHTDAANPNTFGLEKALHKDSSSESDGEFLSRDEIKIQKKNI